MLDKKRTQALLAISLPIIGGMMSQNILNLVDSAMVGQLGSTALGAVGLGGFINYMCVAFFLGFGAGVQAMVARRMGEDKSSEAANPLHAALIIIGLTAIPVTVILYWLSPYLFQMTNSDPEVLKQGVPYLQTRFLGLVFLGLHFSFRGYWSGINMTGVYLKALLIAHSCNIAISYVLIFGKFGFPEMGTAGAGLGTSISMMISTFYYFYIAINRTKGFGFMQSWPKKETVKQVIKTSIPSSFQQFFFAAGFTVLFWIVGQVGTEELAGANVIINLMLVGILPALGIGIGGATLVGKSLGQNNPELAHQWGWEASKLAGLLVIILMIPVVFLTEPIMKVFLAEQSVRDVTRLPLQLAALSLAIESIGIVLFNTINGAGDTSRVMKVSFTLQWLMFLPAAWFIGPYLGMGLTAIWVAHIVYRMVLTVVMIVMWQGRKWSAIEV